jgi:CubicO group peptidase (beta-lactamase class C family)
MPPRSPLRMLFIAAALASFAVANCASAPANAEATDRRAMSNLVDYARNQNSTSLLVIQNGQVVVEEYWPAPEGDRLFPLFVYGRASDGALLEDVASQQKSFIAILAAIAVDRGLLDVEKPVSDYIGAGWSRATPEQEAQIRVVDVLNMNSGLDESFAFSAPAHTTFFYNTPVYAVTKRVLEAAAGQSLDVITREWLTAPLGMADTEWRRRPAALASVGNDTGLVTTPRDTARFGYMVLNRGVAHDGTRVVSEAGLDAMFARTATNPAYGRLWWLNGGEWVAGAQNGRREGSLVSAAPADMVSAFGAFNRRLYIVPSRNLIVVRTGGTAGDQQFDEQLWQRLMRVID